MTYTEQQIHELSGRELDIAVCEIVLGDDLTANTDSKRVQAAREWVQSGETEWRLKATMYTGLKTVAHEMEHPDGTLIRIEKPVDLWNSRHGKPYQSDIEQHVANWRAEPDVGDVWALWRDNWDLYRSCDKWVVLIWLGHDDEVDVYSNAKTPEEAVKRAAIIAKLREAE